MFGWILFIYVAYKTSQYDYELANFDPYEILGVELGSSSSVIKKAYHKLSLIHHPDKATGDEKTFMKLTKAYQVINIFIFNISTRLSSMLTSKKRF